MQLNRQQVQTILDNAPKGVDKTKILDGLISRGYELEGIDNSKARELLKPKQPATDQMSPEQADKFLNKSTVGQIFSKETAQELPKAAYETLVGGAAKFVKSALESPVNIVQGLQGKEMTTANINDPVTGKPIGSYQTDFQNKILPAVESGQISPLKGTVQAVGGPVLGAADVLGAGELVSGGAKLVKTGAEQGSKLLSSTKQAVSDIIPPGGGGVGTSFIKRISEPDVSQATKVSLNPSEALRGTKQDIQVSIGGKLKNISEATPQEIEKLKVGTAKNVDNFTVQAEKFANDRGVKGGSPVEIVGQRTDRVLDIADKKRQSIGSKMGAIEQRFADTVVPMQENTFKQFADIVDYSKNPKYGVSSQNAPVVQEFINNFDTLNASGLTVKERNDFIRNWTEYLRDAKDPFGNFKENATVNTKIQNAVNTLKTETVDAIPDKTYRNLRKQYAEYKKLDEIGNQLLGKDGALGERVKGAATVKRAIQSNSDAGARQFLIKLKQLTGYDAIKEGDLALTAMENVGDYQGLSLLNIIQEGKTGIINKALEKGQDILVGDKATRVKKYIRK